MSQHPEAIQWRNVRKIVKALADWGFGSPNDPNYGHCHITMTTGLTAKDGPDFSVIGLESFPTDTSISQLRPLLDEVARRGEKMGGDGSSFTVTIDAEMWEQIKDHV